MESYVSCIKIHGTPILPPLMTDILRAEMKYYKQLALAKEGRLKLMNNLQNEEEIYNSSFYEYETISRRNSITLSRQQSLSSSEIGNPYYLSTASCDKKSFNESERLLKITSENATLKKNTDVRKYMNTLDLLKTNLSEAIVGTGKPQVPTSLNIIPITVETPKLGNKKSSSIKEGFREEDPKLVRQGSYTLETPSSILLDYITQSKHNDVPTLSRNESNLSALNSIEMQAEICHIKVEKDYSEECDKQNNKNYVQKWRSSVSENGYMWQENSTADEQLVGVIHQITRSMDCIQTALSKEYVCGMTNLKRNYSDEKLNRDSNSVTKINAWKMIKNASVSNLPKKFEGSSGLLSDENSPNKFDYNKRMTKSFETSFSDSYNKQNKKKIELMISDKLINVFKEIQKTHQRQMADLMARQQHEQIILQQEFKKQRLVLLEQLRKSFPGVSIPSIINKYLRSPVHDNNQYNFLRNSFLLPKSRQNHSDGESSIFNGSSFESEGSVPFNCVSIRDTSFSNKMNSEKRKSSVSRKLFSEEGQEHRNFIINDSIYNAKHIKAATVINAYVRGYLVRRLMKTERVIALKNTYKDALLCMLELHVDAPWELSELNFHQRLQHQCDAASISIVELFAQIPAHRMEIIFHDRQIKKLRQERPSSVKSTYSFATQRTLARKKFKELGIIQLPVATKNNFSLRTRCQTWTSNSRKKSSSTLINQGIKRSTSAGTVRKPWR